MFQANSKHIASVLAIDPGRAKCGFAVVNAQMQVLHCETAAIIDFETVLARLLDVYQPAAVAVGNGTGSREITKLIRERCPNNAVVKVDESHTTLEARKLWHELHPARGLRRLMPKCLRTPDGPCDDLTAVVIAHRYWRNSLAETSASNKNSEGNNCETRPLSP